MRHPDSRTESRPGDDDRRSIGPDYSEARVTIPFEGWEAEYLFIADGAGGVRLVGCTHLRDCVEAWRAPTAALWALAETPRHQWRARSAFYEQVPDWWVRYGPVSYPAEPPLAASSGRGGPKLTPRQLAARLRDRGRLSDTQYTESRRRARNFGLLTAKGERGKVVDWLLDLTTMNVPCEAVEEVVTSTENSEQVAARHRMTVDEVERVRVGATLMRDTLATERNDIVAGMLEVRTETVELVRSGEWGPPMGGGISRATRGLLRYVGSAKPEDIAAKAAEKGITVQELRERYGRLVETGHPGVGEPLTASEEAALADAEADARAHTEEAAARAERIAACVVHFAGTEEPSGIAAVAREHYGSMESLWAAARDMVTAGRDGDVLALVDAASRVQAAEAQDAHRNDAVAPVRRART